MERSLYAAIQEIRQHKKVSFYLLYGSPDSFAAEWLTAEIQQSVQQIEGVRPERMLVGYSAENWASCLTTAYEGDLFAPRQIVLCTGFDVVTSAGKSKTGDVDVTGSFTELFKTPPELPMIFFTTAEKLDERKKLTKQFLADNRSMVIALHKISHDAWEKIMTEWSLPDLTLSPQQKKWLEERSAGSLATLHQEIEKLRLFSWGSGHVTDEEFLALCADRGTGDLFTVVREIVAEDFGKAYELYRKLGGQDSFFVLLTLLARQYRLIARIHAEPDAADAVLARTLGVHPYGVKVAREQSKRVSARAAQLMLIRLNALETQVKTGQIQEKLAADWFFLQALATR